MNNLRVKSHGDMIFVEELNQKRYSVQKHGWGWIVFDSHHEDGTHPACWSREDADALCKEMNEEYNEE